jgi:hypothetical protein
MAYQKIDIVSELKRAAKGRPTKADPYVLLFCIADEYLDMLESGTLRADAEKVRASGIFLIQNAPQSRPAAP